MTNLSNDIGARSHCWADHLAFKSGLLAPVRATQGSERGPHSLWAESARAIR